MKPRGAKETESVNSDTPKEKHQATLEESTCIYSTG